MSSQPPPADGVSVDPDTPLWRQRTRQFWYYARWPVYAGAALFGLLLVAGIWLWVTTDLPAAASLNDSAVLVDRNGDELAVLAQDGLRLDVSLDEMAPSVPDALIAAEDHRFYEHGGVDPLGIARAVWNNVRHDNVQGGSTITQQLVKNLYLDNRRTLGRKVREAILAVKVERRSTKAEILERYLNTVYFGRGAYGIEAAARTYFDIHAADLRPDQAALLVGMLRAPERLDPSEAPDAAKKRRDAVLDDMGQLGSLEPAEVTTAKQTPIEVKPASSPTTLSAGVAAHFVEKVRAEIVDRFGERALYDRGLVIHTTLDIADQKAAEAAVAQHLNDPDDPQAAVIGVDKTGAVRAWVGGKDFNQLQLDLVADEGGSGRQPGSTFKPLVLTANFEAGYGAGQKFRAPGEITLDIPPEPWTVSNAGGKDYGTLSLFEGTVHSVNTVYAQALVQVGPKAVADLADKMGINRELAANPSIALGAEEVSPYELATVYSTFARSGKRIDPYTYTKVETRDGDVLWEMEEPEATQVIEPKVADTVSAVLSEVPKRGTATRAALDRPMAAKTGTTQRNADAWLAGYTPEYTAIVWVGYADGTRTMDTVDGQRVQGGSVPAEIWHDFMAEALSDVPPTPFPKPDPELLGDTTPKVDLAASPRRVKPGEKVVVTGTGFEVCVNDWHVIATGPEGGVAAPASAAPALPNGDPVQPTGEAVHLETATQPHSKDSQRHAEFIVPAHAANGTYRVAAVCGFGAGVRPYGPTATFVVDDGSVTTTSSTSSTSSSSSSSTSTTSGQTSTTTTTKKPKSTTTTTTTQPTTTSTTSTTAA